MKNYHKFINHKVRLLCLGSALAIAPITSTFAILPMMLEAFEPSSVTVASANEKQWHNIDDSSREDSYLDIDSNTAKKYESKLLASDVQQIPIVRLSERTTIMRATL